MNNIELEMHSIDNDVSKLKNRLEFINNWIIDNPDTDPNFYEICDCWIKLGNIINDSCTLYDCIGYPRKLATNKESSWYNLIYYDDHLCDCYEKMKKMEQLRN